MIDHAFIINTQNAFQLLGIFSSNASIQTILFTNISDVDLANWVPRVGIYGVDLNVIYPDNNGVFPDPVAPAVLPAGLIDLDDNAAAGLWTGKNIFRNAEVVLSPGESVQIMRSSVLGQPVGAVNLVKRSVRFLERQDFTLRDLLLSLEENDLTRGAIAMRRDYLVKHDMLAIVLNTDTESNDQADIFCEVQYNIID
jgi:hypothetical protein